MPPEEDTSELREVVITSDPTIHGALVGHFGESQFRLGGPDGAGHVNSGPNPYDLLEASLAACTAMTVRFQAPRQKLSLERLEVGVIFQHETNGERDWFERTLVIEGNLDAQQRAFPLEAANLCPVAKILSIGVDIRTSSENTSSADKLSSRASYEDDLGELQIPYVDAD